MNALAIGAVLLAAREALLAIERSRRRREMFSQAVARSMQTGKPLLVIGDPDSGAWNAMMGRDYGCGDICIDLQGCLRCTRSIRGRVEDVLPKIRSSSHVVFVSCVLEYVDDANLVLAHLQRISGGDLYIVTVQPESIAAWVYPGAKRVYRHTSRRTAITARPPGASSSSISASTRRPSFGSSTFRV